MQAIVLAAGMGKRLKELTKDNTKCMVKVGGVTLIERLLKQLEPYHLEKIIIVAGYEAEKLIGFVKTLDIKTPISFIINSIYDKTNNIYSLYLAKDELCCDDTLLFESDIIFEDSVLEALVNDERPTLALVDKYESWMDGTCAVLRDDDSIEKIVPGKQFDYKDSSAYFKTVNIYKFSRDFSEKIYVPFLEAYSKALGNNEYYEQVLRVITMLDMSGIRAKRLGGQKWYEIDDIQDLDIAESIFATGDEKAKRLSKRYGGYWRYPKMTDFCYLVNPYYPPKKMEDEIAASFHTLLTQYPSGMDVNSLLAARNFEISKENILVGNGAAEIINHLVSDFDGNFGFIRPTFEEYPNRSKAPEKDVIFNAQAPDFSYSADDIISFFDANPVKNLVLINPDNPTGNYIKTEDVKRIVRWAAEKNMRLIYDESFSDFAKDPDHTLLLNDYVKTNPHLYIIKSLSKCYGVPGLRLGILASGDVRAIETLKKKLSIWNINSFAEFFMQIFAKYRKEYDLSTKALAKERERFACELKKLPGVKVYPSEANYIMVCISGSQNAHEISVKLLNDYNLIVKDLSGKMPGSGFMRFAVRNTEDNNKLTEALKEIL
ncbi:MAG: aminotransferase class I/II-fold pyridoxal phosphate-dependent enzyme [Lachnospiraceae bacterium]|nr:aminotransferase class I/II-fold pyridoxal phosphate-dependent enzyme [Lachnospiraceae bacterium]